MPVVAGIHCRLPDSTSRRVEFEYEYLREFEAFEAKIGMAQNIVWGTYAEPIFAKKNVVKTGSLPCPFQK